MSRARRYFTVEKKAQIVRRHLADNVPVSDLADEEELLRHIANSKRHDA